MQAPQPSPHRKIMITINENLIVLDGSTSLGGVVEAIQNQPARASEIRDALMLLTTSIRAEGNQAANALSARIDTVTANLTAEKEAAIATLTSEKDALQTALTEAKAVAAAAVQEKTDTLTANEAEVELIRKNTKTAITTAAQYLQALTETELSEAQAAAVSGLSGVLAFAAKSEIQRQYDAAQAALAEAKARADALAAQLELA